MTPSEYDQFIKELVEEDTEQGAVLVTTNESNTDVYSHVSHDRDARFVSLWLLGAFINHVTHSMNEAGGNVTTNGVAGEAIRVLREEYRENEDED